MFLSFHCN